MYIFFQDYDEEFKYIDSIRMIDLTLINYEHEPLSFLLKNYPQCKKGNAAMFTYLLEAKSPRIKQVWSKAIEDRLWQQLYGFRGLHIPILNLILHMRCSVS